MNQMIKNNQRFSFLMCLLMMVAGGCYAQDTQENNTSLKERAKKSHQAFKKEVLSEYNRFRREVNEEYARFMEKSWENYGIEAPINMPKSKKLEPVEYNQKEEEKLLLAKKKELEEALTLLAKKRKEQEAQQQKLAEEELRLQQQQLDENQKKQLELQKKLLAEEKARQEEQQKDIDRQKQELENGMAIEGELVVIKEDKRKQPQPVKPVGENNMALAKKQFLFYGTPYEVRWGNADHFKLADTDNVSITKAYLELTDSGYDNLLHDCLALRKDKGLCDWAYYKMLQAMSEASCGKATNEAVLLQGVLFQQSGYMMRFALDEDKKLHILSRLNGTVYNRAHWIVEDEVGKRIFWLMDGYRPKNSNLSICDVPYIKEQTMNFSISQLPELDTELSTEREYYSGEPKLVATASVNKNMIDFFNDYPASIRDSDVTTRWLYYANAPLTKEVKNNLYNKLKPQLVNTSKLMAANTLLAWVQNSFNYALDERVWGSDRAFFAEETLYYQYCDCEDKAILYSYLVRDLLGLDVVLLFYPEEPQHMYTAICFDDDEVQGDFTMVNGRKYIIADPTCYNAPVGHTMNRIDNSKAKIIPLKRL